jgi:hypothetical protein
MLARDTSNLHLTVSLSEIEAPLRVAAARLRAQPLRPALVVGGVALAFALLVSILGGSLVARQQALRRTLAATPESARGFRIDRFGVTLDARGYAQADRVARHSLTALAPGAPRRVVLLRELRVHGELVELGAASDLASVVRVRSGRLPQSCTASECEVLQIGGGGLSKLAEGDVRLRRVGIAALRDPRIFGDISAATAANGVRPILLLTPSVEALQRQAALQPFYRIYSWVSPLPLDGLRTWQIGRILSDESRAQAAIATDRAMQLSGPDAALLDAAHRGRVAANRLVLVGGELSALLLGFAVIAAIGLRRGLAAERRRLLTRGARRWQVALASIAEIATITLGGALLGIGVGSAITAAVAATADVPAGQILAHTLLSTRTALALGCGWLAATALLTLTTFTRDGDDARRPIGLLDVAAVGAAATLAVALSRGSLDPESLTFGGTALFLLLPVLVCFVVAVVLARLLGPAMRGAEHVTRNSRISPRLAALALARAPSRTVAGCAFVSVALGLALFAATYRATLDRGAGDQAAFQVPLDFTLAEGPRLLKPLDAAPLQRFKNAAGATAAYPVVRLAATTPGRGSNVLSPTVLGVPAAALERMYWRSDFSSLTREALARQLARGGPVRAAGVPVPAGATALATDVHVRGEAVDLQLVVEDERGRVRTVPLRQHGSSAASGTLPSAHLRVLGIQLMLPALQQFFLAHRESEGEVAATPLARLRLGPLRARSSSRSSIVTDWRGWSLPSGGSVRRARDGVQLDVQFQNTGASLAFRPKEPTDGRPLAVVASRDVASAAGGIGSRTVLDFKDVEVPARIVGVAKRVATVPTESGPFVLAEESQLATAVNAGAPGQGTPAEIWVSSHDATATEAALRRPPFAALALSSRSQLEHALATDPLAHATALALGAAALVALVLAVLGFWVGILSEVRDERSDFFDLEVQGLAPRALRAQLRARAVMLIVLGLAGGLALGLLLSSLVVSLVRISAATNVPEPPLRFDAAWPLVGGSILTLLVLALAVTEATSLAAFRDARPRRTSWSLE